MLAPKAFHPDIRSSFVVVVLKMSKMTFFSELPFADSKLGFCDLVLGFPSIFSDNPLQCLGSKKLARRPEISCSIFLVELSVMYSMSWYHKLKKHTFLQWLRSLMFFYVFLYSPSTYDFVPLVDVLPKPDFCSSTFPRQGRHWWIWDLRSARGTAVSFQPFWTPDMFNEENQHGHGFFQLPPLSWCAWWNC